MEARVIDPVWHDLNNIQRDILVALARAGPASGADVHRRLRGDEPRTEGVTIRNLQDLEARGLLTREADEDDDRVLINALTIDGVALLRRGVLEPASEINARDEPLPRE